MSGGDGIDIPALESACCLASMGASGYVKSGTRGR
jgi:hypothetical protein